MKKNKLLIATLAVVGLVGGGFAVAQVHEAHSKPGGHDHGAAAATEKKGHDHGAPGNGTATAGLKLDNGKKWQTDPPLRAAMENIRGGVVASIPKVHSDQFTPADYQALGKKIDGEINNIMAQCKLSPEADAQAHLVLSDLWAGTSAMKGEGDRSAGVVKAIRALNAYGEYFDHPGWQKISHD